MTRYFTSVWCPVTHSFPHWLLSFFLYPGIPLLPMQMSDHCGAIVPRSIHYTRSDKRSRVIAWGMLRAQSRFIIPDLTFWSNNWTTSYSAVHSKSENKSNTHGVLSTFFPFACNLFIIYSAANLKHSSGDDE